MQVFLSDAEGNALAIDPGADAAQVFEVGTVRELRAFIRDNVVGIRVDDAGDLRISPVAHVQVFNEGFDVSDQVAELLG